METNDIDKIRQHEREEDSKKAENRGYRTMSNEAYQKIQKFMLEFRDKSGQVLQYEQSSTDGSGLRHVVIPFDTDTYNPEKINAKLYTSDAWYEEIDDDYEFLQWLVTRNDELGDGFENRMNESSVLRDFVSDRDYFRQLEEDKKFPVFKYEDVTERDLFGYTAINSSDLKSDNKGLWTYHGFRKFEITIDGLDEEREKYSDCDIKASLFWYMVDSQPIENLFVDEIRYNSENKKYYAYIDTNALGNLLESAQVESKAPRIVGRFELHHIFTSEKNVYSFPIEMCIHDTSLNEKHTNECIEQSVVSIDFGTSSTCAAVKSRGKNKLFTLSGPNKVSSEDNVYENPTNLMIYNWSELFRQWDAVNKNCPFIITKSEMVTEKFADYDSGYTVDDEFKKVDEKDGKRKMDAILKHLKMIPYKLSEGKEIKFIPYWDREHSNIRVVDDVADENGTHFNPIAFYGYLLSRAINNPVDGSIYKTYQITYPAKFDKEVREKIRASLEYGIKRALPLPIREGLDKKGNPLVSVKMQYSEPVACVGAVVRKQLKLGDKNAKMFAIYDIGGGTMDFAFGVLRKAVNEELRKHKQVIEILGIDGNEKIGGEKLIHQLSYKIYKDSRETIEENKIKFVLPEGELNPKGFDGLLSTGDENADTNVNIINEHIARPLFQYNGEVDNIVDILGEDTAMDQESCKLKLRDYDGQEIETKLTVVGVDEFLKDKITETIEAFKYTLRANFQKNIDKLREWGIEEFSESDVMIFLGGNASKQYYVKKLMLNEEIGFGANQFVEFIGEGQEDEELSDEYTVNCKTAVAFGQLALSAYGFNSPSEDNPPFLFNVGYYDEEDEFVTVLEKNDNSKSWKQANYVDGESETINILYTTSPTKDADSMQPCTHSVEDFFEDDKCIVYLRVHDEDHIEFRLCDWDESPSDDEEVNEEMLIKLENN